MASKTDFIGQVFFGGESSAAFKRSVRKASKKTGIAIGKGVITGGNIASKVAIKARKAASKARISFREFQRKRGNILEKQKQERVRQSGLSKDFFERR